MRARWLATPGGRLPGQCLPGGGLPGECLAGRRTPGPWLLARRHQCLPFWALALLLASVALGCAPAPIERGTAEAEPAPAPAASRHDSPVSSAAAAPSAAAGEYETWEAIFIQGSQVGYNHNVYRPFERGGVRGWEVETDSQLVLLRFGERTVHTTRAKSIERDDGQVESFEIETQLGAHPTVTRGTVRGGQLELRTITGGHEAVATLPWPDDCRGLQGVEQSLEREPLAPGQRRRLQIFLPILNAPGDVSLAAAQRERTRLLEGDADLLRVEMQIRLPQGTSLESTLWVDEQGAVLKSRMQAAGQEIFRTTRSLALDGGSGAGRPFDLGIDAIVRLARPLHRPHERRARRYRVTLRDGDPAVEFRPAAYQQVQSIDPHTAEISVWPLEPAEPAGEEPPVEADRLPNAWIQSDDPRIIELARAGRGAETDPWRTCLALEAFVHRTIHEVNFSQAFATAAEVAESRQGDCTEHAVLLAALARASGIPARVAIGLVYVERYQGFGFHMWTEVNLRDRWLPLDATLGRGGIGGAHLKLADTSLAGGGGALECLVPVAKIMGRLGIEPLEDRLP